ncbi:MAG: hypothetical protein ABIH92_01430, partial [Nanoarchaeota archaeon]
MTNSIDQIIEKLSPLERKILPYLNLSFEQIEEATSLDNTSLLRALKFLENKKLVKVKTEKKRIVELGTNGVYYKKNHLPERRLIQTLESQNHLSLEEAKKLSKLSDNEFKVSLGILKNKSFIDLKNGKISLIASKEILTRKTIEESLLELLPAEEQSLSEEQLFTLNLLKKRKDIIEIEEKNIISFSVTELGKQIASKKVDQELIEEVTPTLIKNWKKNKKFRKYDIDSNVPMLCGGKKHFVNSAIEQGKRIWLDMGFKEMTGPKVQTSFWNFDALFTAQDHPVRELQDTFYIKGVEGSLPDKKIVNKVKQAHESG